MKVALDQREQFYRDGFTVIRNVFDKHEIDKLRDALHDIRQKSRERGDTLYDNAQPLASFIKGDLCSFRELDDFDFVVCNKRIVEGVKSLIGDDLVYFGESNTQTGTAARGNHKDNRIIDREDASGYDWKGDYSLVRVGLYLNDSDSTSGGLKVIPGSHKYRLHTLQRVSTLVRRQVILWCGS